MSSQPDLFSPAAAAGRRALRQAAENHADEIELLAPIARELAATNGTVTVSELRLEAEARGFLTSSSGRELSYLGAVMKRAGLVRTGEYARSALEASHGNLQAVWRSR